ncbi:Cytochrome C oxidase subunit IV, prokaryotes [Flavobacteriaceae bacterium]|jgi:hypothetical protein
MKKSLLIVYGILLVLTLTTAFIANSFSISIFVVSLLMGLAVAKFMLVAYQFMELKKANTFWKISLIMTLILLVLVIILLK